MARTRTNRVSFAPRSGVKRATKWLGSATITDKTNLTAATAILDQAFTSAQIDVLAAAGGTIIRTRGSLWVAPDTQAAVEQPFGALGMMVVREQARVAGVASIPTPVTESPDDGFFVHQWWQAGIHFGTAVAFTNLWSRYDFDSKAQRKFTGDDAIVVTLENGNATDAVDFILQFRMLIMPGSSR